MREAQLSGELSLRGVWKWKEENSARFSTGCFGKQTLACNGNGGFGR